jgi:acyl-CoA thioester hydrolase
MGFVHHSVYLIWFEVGRTEWMRQKGLTYRDCEAKGWLLPLVEAGAQYHHPAHYDDLVEIETTLRREKGVSFRFDYIVKNMADGLILATGFTKHVCIGLDHKINRAATKRLQQLFM